MILSENITGSDSNVEFVIEIGVSKYRLELFEDAYMGYDSEFCIEKPEPDYEVVSITRIGAKEPLKKPMRLINKHMLDITEQIYYQLEEQPFNLL